MVKGGNPLIIKKKMKMSLEKLWGKGPNMERNIAFMLFALFVCVLTTSASTAALITPIEIDINKSISIFAVISGSGSPFAISNSARGM